MNTFKKILVVFNDETDNQALIDQAVSLAKSNGATITAIDVVEPRTDTTPILTENVENLDPQLAGVEFIEELPGAENIMEYVKTKIGGKPEILIGNERFNVQEFFLQQELDHFEGFVSALRNGGVEVKGIKVNGIAFIEIIREVIKNQHDLVMLSAEGGEHKADPLFGNTTMHLVRKCPCPV